MTIQYDLPAATYHDGTHCGSHAIADFARLGPRGFWLRHIKREVQGEESASMSLGTAVHAIILEGEQAFHDAVAVQPETYTVEEERKPWNRRVQACKTWEAEHPGETPPEDYVSQEREVKPWTYAAGACKAWRSQMQAEGRTVIDSASLAAAMGCLAGVRDNPHASELLRRGMAEVTIRRIWSGLPVQVRVDWVAGDGPDPGNWKALVDLKTTDNIMDFRRECQRYGYIHQAQFYRWQISEETARPPLPFYLIAVENKAPHRCITFCIDHAWQEDAGAEVREWAAGLAAVYGAARERDGLYCHEYWPRFLDAEAEGLQMLDRPQWQGGASDEL